MNASGVQDEWTSIYSQAEARLNTPSGMVSLPALTVMRLVTALRRSEANADRNALLYIEASNPGIDIEQVKRDREARQSGSTGRST